MRINNLKLVEEQDNYSENKTYDDVTTLSAKYNTDIDGKKRWYGLIKSNTNPNIYFIINSEDDADIVGGGEVFKANSDYDAIKRFEDYKGIEEYNYIKSKDVLNSDGSYVQYAMYRDNLNGTYIFMFDDDDNPDRDYADWVAETLEEADEWYDCYTGFDDDDDWDDFDEDETERNENMRIYRSNRINEAQDKKFVIQHKNGKYLSKEFIVGSLDRAKVFSSMEDAVAFVSENGKDRNWDRFFEVVELK